MADKTLSPQRALYLNGLRRQKRRVRTWQAALLLGLFALWELSCRWGWSDGFLVSCPSRIWQTLTSMTAAGQLWRHIAVSCWETVVGFTAGTLLGTAAAIGFHAMKRRPRHLLMTINNIPMTNADIITGVSLMLLFVFTGNMLGFSLGFGTLLVAHITFNIPYVVLAVLPKLRQLNPNLGEAAMDLGATPWQAFWKVLMPELRPGILNGLLIAFTLSIDDFVISYFTAGSEVSTLAMQIYAMTRKRISPEVNALSTILFVVVLSLLLIVNFREMHQTKQAEKRNKALQKDGVKGGTR